MKFATTGGKRENALNQTNVTALTASIEHFCTLRIHAITIQTDLTRSRNILISITLQEGKEKTTITKQLMLPTTSKSAKILFATSIRTSSWKSTILAQSTSLKNVQLLMLRETFLVTTKRRVL